MSEIPEAAVEAVLGTQHIQDHLGGSIDADDVRSILEAAMPAIRQQVDEVSRLTEKIEWQARVIARLIIDRDQARQENAQVMADYTDLQGVINQCGEAAEVNGWHDRYRYLEDMHYPTEILEHLICKTQLIGNEVSEAIEELRDGHAPDETYESEGGKPEGYGVELADVVIRVFDLAWMLDLDLPGLIDQKLSFNASRGERHGGKRI